ncbi:MAG: nitroreductase family protein [Bacteroidales bacterium]|nr:nitroreductase family protein [Bacteroidales bacterium]
MKDKSAKTNFQIHELLTRRWSPRAFDAQKIEKEKLQRIFEAARWSPSASNEQPWHFIIGEKGDETFARIFETLVEFNQLWVKTAPLAGIIVGRENLLSNGKINFWYKYDVGQAAAHMSFQATHEGLFVHQMGGFDREKARELFHIPEGFEAISAFTIGYIGDYNVLHPNLQRLELEERTRKSTDEFVFSDNFGKKSELI